MSIWARVFIAELFNLFNRDKASKISIRGGKSSATTGAGIRHQFRDKVKDQEKQTKQALRGFESYRSGAGRAFDFEAEDGNIS